MAGYLECDHPLGNQEIRYRDQKQAPRWYIVQCQICGKSLGRIKAVDVPDIKNVKPEDTQIRRVFKFRSQWFHAKERYKEKQAFDKWYAEYLTSPRWREKREPVLQRANNICDVCKKRKATQVHHLTYDRVGDELLTDLVAICKPCHSAIHVDD